MFHNVYDLIMFNWRREGFGKLYFRSSINVIAAYRMKHSSLSSQQPNIFSTIFNIKHDAMIHLYHVILTKLLDAKTTHLFSSIIILYFKKIVFLISFRKKFSGNGKKKRDGCYRANHQKVNYL